MLLSDGFAHRTRYPVAGKILQWLPVAAAVVAEAEAVAALVAGDQALPNSLQHVEAEEVEVVGYLLHTHKASQSNQQMEHTDLPEIKVVVEVVVVAEQQMELAFGWLETWVA